MRKRLSQFAAIVVVGIIVFLIALRIPAFANTFSRFMFGESVDLNTLSSNRINELWLPAWEEFRANPFLGIGWRQFKYLHPMSSDVFNDCHNIYLQLLCETGVLGFLFFILVMGYTYVTAWRALLHEKSNPDSICYNQLMFAFGYQTFFLLYGLTGNPLYDIQCLFPYIIACAFTYKYAYVNTWEYMMERGVL